MSDEHCDALEYDGLRFCPLCNGASHREGAMHWWPDLMDEPSVFPWLVTPQTAVTIYR